MEHALDDKRSTMDMFGVEQTAPRNGDMYIPREGKAASRSDPGVAARCAMGMLRPARPKASHFGPAGFFVD
jgi:hypothetical protein